MEGSCSNAIMLLVSVLLDPLTDSGNCVTGFRDWMRSIQAGQ